MMVSLNFPHARFRQSINRWSPTCLWYQGCISCVRELSGSRFKHEGVVSWRSAHRILCEGIHLHKTARMISWVAVITTCQTQSVPERNLVCFTLLKQIAVLKLSNWRVYSMLPWNDASMFSKFGEHPHFERRLKSSDLLARSNAFVSSIRAMYSGRLCSRNFSSICLDAKITSIIDFMTQKPHWVFL